MEDAKRHLHLYICICTSVDLLIISLSAPHSQLAEVFYVEGLGPAKGDTAMQYMLAPGGTLAPGGLAAGHNIPGLPQVFPVGGPALAGSGAKQLPGSSEPPHSFAEQVWKGSQSGSENVSLVPTSQSPYAGVPVQVKAEHNSEHDLLLHLGDSAPDDEEEEGGK